MTERDVLELVKDNEQTEPTNGQTSAETFVEEVVSTEEAAYTEKEISADATEVPLDEGAGEDGGKIDYESLMREDLAELKREFSELGDIDSLTELSNPLRYAALRDLGLSPKEAYLATTPRKPITDNRSHLSAAVSRSMSRPATSIPPAQLRMARELFRDMSDAEINALYRRVTK